MACRFPAARLTAAAVGAIAFGLAPTALAQSERPSPYRNPAGSINLSAVLGATVGNSSAFVGGVGVGYAVVTGVMPGFRGLLIAGGGVGAEAAATLTLTPPLKGSTTPFVVGEAGRRWDRGIDGWLYGVGGGVFLGDPASTVGFQIGWIQRWYALSDGTTTSLGSPILSFTLRF